MQNTTEPQLLIRCTDPIHPSCFRRHPLPLAEITETTTPKGFRSVSMHCTHYVIHAGLVSVSPCVKELTVTDHLVCLQSCLQYMLVFVSIVRSRR